MNVGIAELKNVMGSKCGMMNPGSVRIVARSDLGSWELGVRIRRVRDASIGERSKALNAADVVAMRIVASGAVVARMSEGEDREISVSVTPMTAARKF